jgi:dTDP-4-amino-4,6-dideoxygalactose transaminase
VNVPFLDLAAANRELRSELDAAIAGVADRSQFVLGPELEAFETAFARYTDTTHCIGVGNGMDALELAIRALGLPEGGEVIVPANTFIATWIAVTRSGGRVVPVEPMESTYNIDPARVAAAITRKTRGIIAVHLYGQPADVAALREIADGRGIWLLEDAAQSHGAHAHGRRTGGWGDAAAWSFYPAKNLGAWGDAGAVTTNSDRVATAVRLGRNYGSPNKYEHVVRGVNSRLDDIQAAVLRVKLAHLDEWNERRRRVAARYLEGLGKTGLVLPSVAPPVDPVWHLFVVRSPERDALQARLSSAGIGTLVHYPVPPHLQPAYADMSFAAGSFPITEAIHREALSLPMGPHMSDGEVDFVIETIRQSLP